MDIRLITDEHIWTAFFEQVGSPSFHHSWAWGEFQQRIGYEILRVGLYKDSTLKAIALVIKITSKRGKFLFIPHGPLFDIQTDKLTMTVSPDKGETIKQELAMIRDYLIALARKEGFWFIRIAPILGRTKDHQALFQSLGFVTAPLYIHAETMWVVDVTQTEDELLQRMRKNIRYGIRRASRDRIRVTKHDSLDAFDDFLRLYKMTSDREDFTPYSPSYIKNEFLAFHVKNNALFVMGGIQEFAQGGAFKKLAGSLVVFTKSAGFYHQGASIHTKFPVTYQVQWQSICEAKRRGCRYYNLYGIYDAGRTPKAWEGLSLFKKGFGGFEVNYLYTQDFVVSPWYFFSFVVDKYIALRRGI